MLTAAPLESARFGLRAFRATLQKPDVAKLFDDLVGNGVDLAILRVPSREAHAIRGLARYGLDPIHADTLVSYECDLCKHKPTRPTADGFSIELAQESDRASIAELVTRVFTGYPTHYLANPLLDPDAILQGYREWALSHLEGEGLVAWVARKDGRVTSIACSAFDASTGACHGVLHGVHPDFARFGIYTALIRHTQQYFGERGFSRLAIQTQAWNMPVQRVWVREGFTLAEVYETFHVNALFDPGRATRHHVSGSPHLRQDVAARMSPAIPPGATETTGAESCPCAFRFTLFRDIEHQTPCVLQTRAYDFEAGLTRLVSGTLFDSAGRTCATAFMSSRNDQ
jgi:GNAT superfamily N-acetyltransferase